MSKPRPILAIDFSGRIYQYSSIHEAARAMRPDQELSTPVGNISGCLKNRKETAYEHKWVYAEELEKAEAISKQFKVQGENDI